MGQRYWRMYNVGRPIAKNETSEKGPYMLRLLLFFAAFATMLTTLHAQSLTSVLTSLGAEWRVQEIFKPEWDWSGTWTRVGNSNVYRASYRNAGSNALKTAEFQVTAESYANGILRLRHPQNGYYSIPVNPGQRSAKGTMSWCQTIGCIMQFEFTGTPIGSSSPVGTPSPASISLTGPWVHSADARTQTPDNRVILVQDGNRVTLTQTYKTSGKWVTLVCQGPITGQDPRMPCNWAAGGNPFGFANGTLNLKISSDGNHLEGALAPTTGGSQESHYSRVP